MEVKENCTVFSIGYIGDRENTTLLQNLVVLNREGLKTEFPALVIATSDKYAFVKHLSDVAAQLWDEVEKNKLEDGYSAEY